MGEAWEVLRLMYRFKYGVSLAMFCTVVLSVPNHTY